MHFVKACKRYCVLPVFCLVISVTNLCKAQDSHFSLYETSPLFLNAANTGNFTGDWRITGNYRNQWWVIDDAIQTAAISLDRKFYLMNQNLGGGLLFLHDNTGSNGLMYNKLYASLAYNRMFNEHFISAGFQAGIVNASASDELTLPDGWNPGTGEFDPSDLLEKDKLFYLDINFGALWKKDINIFTPEVGIALAHINYPKYSFLGTHESLSMKTSIHAGLNTKLNDIYLKPLLYYNFHRTANNMLFGLNGGKKIRGNKAGVSALHGGVYVRNGITSNIDAIAVHAGASMGRIEMRINYDINISNLSSVTGSQGAFEISFIYRSISTVLNSYSIPCNRI